MTELLCCKDNTITISRKNDHKMWKAGVTDLLFPSLSQHFIPLSYLLLALRCLRSNYFHSACVCPMRIVTQNKSVTGTPSKKVPPWSHAQSVTSEVCPLSLKTLSAPWLRVWELWRALCGYNSPHCREQEGEQLCLPVQTWTCGRGQESSLYWLWI